MKERLETVPGVSSVSLWGSKTYAMRLWMSPELMASHGVTVHDISNAIAEQNLEIPSGRIDGDTVELTIKAPSRLATPEDFSQLVVARRGDQAVKFEDIGSVNYGAIERREMMRSHGQPSMMTVVTPQASANHIAIVDEVYARLDSIRANLPEDVRAEVVFDGTDYIRASIDEVVQSLLLALLIVTAVIFLFLGDWRTTLIPVLVIPVATISSDFGGLPVQFAVKNLENERLRQILPRFLSEARQRPEFAFVDVDLQFNSPELLVEIDRERAAALGIPIQRANQTLQLALSELRVEYFLKNSKQYDTLAQIPRESRDDPHDFRNLYVENDAGAMVSLADIIKTSESAGPPLRFRYNRYNTATFSARPAQGYTVGA